MSNAPRLYGVAHSERLQLDIASVYETDIEPYLGDYDQTREYIIEEWTVREQRSLLPSVDRVIEMVLDACDEVTEGWMEDAADRVDPEVESGFGAALDVLASKIRYLMADRKIGEHRLSFDGRGDPLVDGHPLYRKVAIEEGRHEA